MSSQKTKDIFELRIFFSANPLTSWDSARRAVEVLLHEAGDLAPTVFRPRYDKKTPLTMEALEAYFKQRKSSDVLVLTSDQGVSIEWTPYPSGTNPGSKLIYRIPFSLLSDTTRAERVITFTKALGDLNPPLYGWGHSDEDIRLANEPHVTDALAPLQLVQVYWLTILGASMVQAFGRERVASAPAHRVEFLTDGSALVITAELPTECLSPAAREVQAKTLHHLRPDLPYDQVLRDLLARSSNLQPAAKSLNPDYAQLFRMIIDSAPLAERRAKELELTGYQPPPITEIRVEPLPPDVADVNEAIDQYHRQAQTFTAGYHDQIPGLMEAEPESLANIDAFFYANDYLRSDPVALERLMIPTLGAYLGTVLERHLGGSWAPRRNLEESQVIAGNRAWLPFRRVRNFLQSRNAAIDSSLNAYYREAERRSAGG